ncbi:unnamed protein product, partial [Prorocentrum cordatum]
PPAGPPRGRSRGEAGGGGGHDAAAAGGPGRPGKDQRRRGEESRAHRLELLPGGAEALAAHETDDRPGAAAGCAVATPVAGDRLRRPAGRAEGGRGARRGAARGVTAPLGGSVGKASGCAQTAPREILRTPRLASAPPPPLPFLLLLLLL